MWRCSANWYVLASAAKAFERRVQDACILFGGAGKYVFNRGGERYSAESEIVFKFGQAFFAGRIHAGDLVDFSVQYSRTIVDGLASGFAA